MIEFWAVVKESLGLKREDLTELKNIVFGLAEEQKQTELSIKELTRTIDFKIGGLGRKWGVDSERSFRRGLATILS
ncbi:DUF3782 domain-containing protein [Methanospirillum purgamenti]|uniref:DUF3782 domain-containing protein n=1 Tax=Methanospirillum hungatei TaxID=2203 RepID=A0A8F5VIG1_METHU|nr:DUF3782 domain-containing protein [Methanospirillum hungatei]QXO93572.1 DUF3782 domain-containing protein [Methanospirillum hungatei]